MTSTSSTMWSYLSLISSLGYLLCPDDTTVHCLFIQIDIFPTYPTEPPILAPNKDYCLYHYSIPVTFPLWTLETSINPLTALIPFIEPAVTECGCRVWRWSDKISKHVLLLARRRNALWIERWDNWFMAINFTLSPVITARPLFWWSSLDNTGRWRFQSLTAWKNQPRPRMIQEGRQSV